MYLFTLHALLWVWLQIRTPGFSALLGAARGNVGPAPFPPFPFTYQKHRIHASSSMHHFCSLEAGERLRASPLASEERWWIDSKSPLLDHLVLREHQVGKEKWFGAMTTFFSFRFPLHEVGEASTNCNLCPPIHPLTYLLPQHDCLHSLPPHPDGDKHKVGIGGQ